MARINIIGVGPGNPMYLTGLARELIEKSHVLFGDQRLLAPYESMGKALFAMTRAADIDKKIRELAGEDRISVLVSGDSGFYSLSQTLLSRIEDLDVLVVPGISSLQMLASALGLSWGNASIVSMHGRQQPFVSVIAHQEKTFLLLDRENTPSLLCRQLLAAGLEHLIVHVGENLSYENQRIFSGLPKEIIEQQFDSLAVMMVENPNPVFRPQESGGISDDSFLRGEVPMTKQEIRAISLSKLAIRQDDVLYDVGAGTGSVSIEMALLATDGQVYAIEKNKKAIALIEANQAKFKAYNLHVSCGLAPEMLYPLPKPDKVFIGGSSGNLHEILDVVYDKNPDVLVVINAISIETLSEAMAYYKQHTDIALEILSVSVAKAEEIGEYHMMKGQNPIYIITAKKKIEAAI